MFFRLYVGLGRGNSFGWKTRILLSSWDLYGNSDARLFSENALYSTSSHKNFQWHLSATLTAELSTENKNSRSKNKNFEIFHQQVDTIKNCRNKAKYN